MKHAENISETKFENLFFQDSHEEKKVLIDGDEGFNKRKLLSESSREEFGGTMCCHFSSDSNASDVSLELTLGGAFCK